MWMLETTRKRRCRKFNDDQWAGSSGSSTTMNDEALARLIVSKYHIQNEPYMAMEKEERAAFFEDQKEGTGTK